MNIQQFSAKWLLAFMAVTGTLRAGEPQPPQPPQPRPELNIEGAAGQMATEISNKLVTIAPTNPVERHRVAVARFNNKNQSYTLNLGNVGPAFQTALADALRSQLGSGPVAGKYTVPSPETLKEEVISGLNQGIDPDAMSDANVGAARSLLQKYNYQVGVVGRFLIDKLPAAGPFDIAATVITPTSSFVVTVRIGPTDPNQGGVTPQPDPPSKRFAVEVYVKHQPQLTNDALTAAWKKLELRRIKEPELVNNLLLIVPKEYKGSRYKLVLRNNGAPSLGGEKFTSPNDRDRIFLAAVMIDGVGAFWKEEKDPGTGQLRYVPDTQHFSRIKKRVLTAPGRYLQGMPGVTGPRLDNAELRNSGRGGVDHSTATLLGFQRDVQFANAFIFSEAKDSAGAGLIGSINEIGLISVYFYPEYLMEGDSPVRAGGPPATLAPGTRPGEPVVSPVFYVRVNNIDNVPVSIWNIIYRYSDDPHIPASEPFTN